MVRAVLAAILLASLSATAQIRQGGMVKADGSEATTGTVTTTGTLASGQVALGSGAASITGDAGCTWTGTGASFVGTFGYGVVVGAGTAAAPSVLVGDTGFATVLANNLTVANGGVGRVRFGLNGHVLSGALKLGWEAGAFSQLIGGATTLALSQPSNGLLLVEDGSGNARDVQARTGTFGTSVVTPIVGLDSDALFGLAVGGSARWYVGPSSTAYAFLPAGDNGYDIGISLSNRVRTGYFGTSVVTPVVVLTLATPTTSGDTCTAGTFWADASYLYVCTATNTIKRAALSAF